MRVRENDFSMYNLNSVFNYKTSFLSCLSPTIYFLQLLIISKHDLRKKSMLSINLVN